MSSSMKINEVLINLIFEFMNSNNFQQRLLGRQFAEFRLHAYIRSRRS